MNALHHTVLAAPQALAQGLAAPLILEREDEDFITAVLAEYGSAEGRRKLAASRARAVDGRNVRKLFQPLQRRFHVALLEAWCDTPGEPRLDPRKVESAGLVLRRLRRRPGRPDLQEGWMRAAGQLRGWLPVDLLGDAEADPSPERRLAAADTGVASLDRALRALAPGRDAAVLEEQVVPMFVAPPEVCARAGRTLYYGVVPTVSSERAQAPQDTASLFDGFGPESAAFVEHLVQPLRGLAYSFPDPDGGVDRMFDAEWMKVLAAANPPDADQGSVQRARARFLQLLRQLVVEFDALGEGPASKALLAELDSIALERRPEADGRPRPIGAGAFLRDAARVLLEGEGGLVEMPLRWPDRGAAADQRLRQRLHAAMLDRYRGLSGAPGRFDEPGARYLLRGFVRLKAEGGCPARTVWTAACSEPFVIAPWYEGGSAPVQIPLPDLADRRLLRQMKPNVSFVVPPSLQGLLSGDPKKLLDGERSGGSTTIGWICSFSIPVITFCAFIVLNVFLSLFDLIFRWLMFVKICVPFPKKAEP